MVRFAQMFGGNGVPFFGEWIRRRLALDLRDGFFNLKNDIASPNGELCGIRPIPAKQIVFGDFQAVAPQRGIFQFRNDIAGVIVFAVAAQAKQFGDDELRAFSVTRLRDRVAKNLQARGQVRRVNGIYVDTVTNRFVGQISAGKLARCRRRISVLIIRHDEHERQFFNGRLIQSFVKCAGGSRAITQTSRADRAGNFFEAAREQDSVDD